MWYDKKGNDYGGFSYLELGSEKIGSSRLWLIYIYQ